MGARLSALAAAALMTGPGVAAAAPLRALPPVTISAPVPALAPCHLNGDDNTPLIAAQPGQPGHFVVSYLTGDDRAAVVARSDDEGLRWSRTALASLTPCGGGDGWVDPGLIFAAGGTVVAGAGWVDRSGTIGARDHAGVRELLYRSTDGGHEFGGPIEIEPTEPDQRSYFATAPDGSLLVETERAHYLGPTYTYVEPSTLAILRSTNGGTSWSLEGQIRAAPLHDSQAAGLLRAPDGTLVALADDVDLTDVPPWLVHSMVLGDKTALPATVTAARSTDRGRTFSTPMPIARCGGCALSTAATAPDGALLVAYQDTEGSAGSTDVYLARSTDDGRTWTTHRITHVARGADEPTVAARPGQIGVLVTQGTDGPGDPVDDVLWTSNDDGETWIPLKLGGPYSESSISYQHFDGQLGPEQGLVALPDGFAAVFTALRPSTVTDGEQDVVFVRAVTSPSHRRRHRRNHRSP
jgi:hypothetical protein